MIKASTSIRIGWACHVSGSARNAYRDNVFLGQSPSVSARSRIAYTRARIPFSIKPIVNPRCFFFCTAANANTRARMLTASLSEIATRIPMTVLSKPIRIVARRVRIHNTVEMGIV